MGIFDFFKRDKPKNIIPTPTKSSTYSGPIQKGTSETLFRNFGITGGVSDTSVSSINRGGSRGGGSGGPTSPQPATPQPTQTIQDKVELTPKTEPEVLKVKRVSSISKKPKDELISKLRGRVSSRVSNKNSFLYKPNQSQAQKLSTNSSSVLLGSFSGTVSPADNSYKSFIKGREPVTATIEYVVEKTRGALSKREEKDIGGARLLGGKTGERVSTVTQVAPYFIPYVGEGLLIGSAAGRFTKGGKQETQTIATELKKQKGIPEVITKTGIIGLSVGGGVAGVKGLASRSERLGLVKTNTEFVGVTERSVVVNERELIKTDFIARTTRTSIKGDRVFVTKGTALTTIKKGEGLRSEFLINGKSLKLARTDSKLFSFETKTGGVISERQPINLLTGKFGKQKTKVIKEIPTGKLKVESPSKVFVSLTRGEGRNVDITLTKDVMKGLKVRKKVQGAEFIGGGISRTQKGPTTITKTGLKRSYTEPKTQLIFGKSANIGKGRTIGISTSNVFKEGVFKSKFLKGSKIRQEGLVFTKTKGPSTTSIIKSGGLKTITKTQSPITTSIIKADIERAVSQIATTKTTQSFFRGTSTIKTYYKPMPSKSSQIQTTRSTQNLMSSIYTPTKTTTMTKTRLNQPLRLGFRTKTIQKTKMKQSNKLMENLIQGERFRQGSRLATRLYSPQKQKQRYVSRQAISIPDTTLIRRGSGFTGIPFSIKPTRSTPIRKKKRRFSDDIAFSQDFTSRILKLGATTRLPKIQTGLGLRKAPILRMAKTRNTGGFNFKKYSKF